MPKHHKFVANWNPTRFKNWAEKIGANVKNVITHILQNREVPEQAYKTCLGILNLNKKYGNERLDAACKRAIAYGIFTYKAIRSILIKNLDKIIPIEEFSKKIPEHQNIRGSEYYKEELKPEAINE